MIKRIVLLASLLVSSSVQAAEHYKPSEQELRCIAKNIYFESRNQSVAGRAAVGLVTINRMHDKRWPNTACGVVYQAKKRYNVILRNQCQFSWYCDGKADTMHDQDSLYIAREIAHLVLSHYETEVVVDITEGATHYHATSVSPYWIGGRDMAKVTQIGSHIFYRWD